LSAWRFHQRNDEAVFNALAKRSGYPVARDETFAEPAGLQQLRANSNFLSAATPDDQPDASRSRTQGHRRAGVPVHRPFRYGSSHFST
jgi:hypothetical protein